MVAARYQSPWAAAPSIPASLVRLAVGLDHPLEVVSIKEARLDDADPAMPGSEGSTASPGALSAWGT